MRSAKFLTTILIAVLGVAAVISFVCARNNAIEDESRRSVSPDSLISIDRHGDAPAISPTTRIATATEVPAIRSAASPVPISPSAVQVLAHKQAVKETDPEMAAPAETVPAPQVSLGVPVEVETKLGAATWTRMEDDDNPLQIGIPSAKRVIQQQEILKYDYWYQSFLETSPTFIQQKDRYLVQLNEIRSQSLFQNMGFRKGDRLESIDGVEAPSVLQIPFMISRLSRGQECFVMLEREGTSFGLSIQPLVTESASDDDEEDLDERINTSYRLAAERLVALTSTSLSISEALQREQNPLVKQMYRDMIQRQPAQ